MRPGVGRSLRRSAALFAARPVTSLALGAAVVLSLVAVCLGVGVVAAPWFLCELFGVQLAEATGKPVERGRAWLAACALLLGAVVLVSSVAWLSLLGLGADPLLPGPPRPAAWSELAAAAGTLTVAATLAALVFLLPLLYAPLVLIDGGASLGGAVLESARLVSRGGALAHLRLSLAAHALQLAPLALAGLAAARLAQAELVPLAVLASIPLLTLSVPLGQGMIATAYAERRSELVDRRRTRAIGRPPRALAVLWFLLVLTPPASFVLLGASLVRPSRIAPGRAPDGLVLADATLSAGETWRFRPLDSALSIRADAHGVEVRASDGGGVGRLPLERGERVDHVRVVELRDSYAIELGSGMHARTTWIDRAGVRLDDGLRRRLHDRAPPSTLATLLASLLLTALVLLPTFTGLAEVRRAYALPPADRPSPSVLHRLRARTLRRASLTGLLLAPLAIASLRAALVCLGL